MEKFDRIFGLSSTRLDRIGIKQIAEVRLRGELRDQLDIEPCGRIAQREVGEFVVDIAVEDYQISIGLSRSLRDPAERHSIYKVQTKPYRSHER